MMPTDRGDAMAQETAAAACLPANVAADLARIFEALAVVIRHRREQEPAVGDLEPAGRPVGLSGWGGMLPDHANRTNDSHRVPVRYSVDLYEPRNPEHRERNTG